LDPSGKFYYYSSNHFFKAITKFEKEFTQHVRTNHQDLLKIIREEGQITPQTDEKLKTLVTSFLAGFKA
jgi:F-type H+-transporting ATPase subunit alpha